MIRPRTQSRVFALQMLYQAEITDDPINVVQEGFWKTNEAPGTVKHFTDLLVEGTISHLATIDSAISSVVYTEINWELHRMPAVDRCLLRSAAYELLYLIDIPPAVSINEAIEIARAYSTDDSPQFVNAILDKIKDIGTEVVGLEHLRTSGGE